MPAKYVRPYSKGQKNDFNDAEAIAEAVQRPCARRDRRSAGRDKGTALGSNKGTERYEEQAMT
jgi:transposase